MFVLVSFFYQSIFPILLEDIIQKFCLFLFSPPRKFLNNFCMHPKGFIGTALNFVLNEVDTHLI